MPGMIQSDGRHPSTAHLAQLLAVNPNLPPHLGSIAQASERLAAEMVDALPDGPELSAGLRKLLEAKDCFVRAALP